MAKTSVILDTGLLVALFNPRDDYHEWARSEVRVLPPPWKTCEPVLTETFFMLDKLGTAAVRSLLRRDSIVIDFHLAEELEPVLNLMEKYADIPMSLADACVVRMTEILKEPLVLTTDSDFRLYRRNGRQVIPCRMS